MKGGDGRLWTRAARMDEAENGQDQRSGDTVVWRWLGRGRGRGRPQVRFHKAPAGVIVGAEQSCSLASFPGGAYRAQRGLSSKQEIYPPPGDGSHLLSSGTNTKFSYAS